MTAYSITNRFGAREFVPREQWLKIIGTEDNWQFAHKVYTGQMSLDDVPPEYKDEVAKVVEARLEFSGEYRLPAAVALAELLGVLDETQ